MTDKDFEGIAQECVGYFMRQSNSTDCQSYISDKLRTVYTQGQNDALNTLPQNLAFARNESIEEAIRIVKEWPGPGGIIMVNDISDPLEIQNGLRSGIVAKLESLKTPDGGKEKSVEEK